MFLTNRETSFFFHLLVITVDLLSKFLRRAHIFSVHTLVVNRLLLTPRRRPKKRNLTRQRRRPSRKKPPHPPLLRSPHQPLLLHLNQRPPLPPLALVDPLSERSLGQLQEERFFRRKNSTLKFSSYSRNRCKSITIAFVFHRTANFKLHAVGKRAMTTIRHTATTNYAAVVLWSTKTKDSSYYKYHYKLFINLLLVYHFFYDHQKSQRKILPKLPHLPY